MNFNFNINIDDLLNHVYIDMDGVLCDFEGKVTAVTGKTPNDPDWQKIKDEMSNIPDFYKDLPPMPGAIEAFNRLCHELSPYTVYILSTPSWDSPSSYMDKRIWVEKYLGDIGYKKLILSHNKGLMVGRALIDDRIKNGAAEFRGEHIHFGTSRFPDWDSILKYLLP